MAFRSFRHNFHDASLVGFSVGPRREVTLEIKPDSVWNKTAGIVLVRFGAVDNFNEVKSFLEELPAPPSSGASLAEIIGLKYEKEKPYPVLLALANVGHVVIRSKKVTEAGT